MRSLLFLALATATLAGCTVGPQFSPPKVQYSTNYAEISGQVSTPVGFQASGAE